MNKQEKKLIERIAERFEISVNWCEDYAELSYYSSYGQDYFMTIQDISSAQNFLYDLTDFVEYYDVDKEASKWIGPDGHGQYGAPYRITDIIADAEEIKQVYKDFQTELRKQIL